MRTLLSLLTIVLSCCATLSAQASGLDRGIELYNQGKFQKAIDLLSADESPVGLLYLGMSYEQIHDNDKSRAAFERSLKSSYGFFFDAFVSWRKNSKGAHFADFIQDSVANCQAGSKAALEANKLNSSIFLENEWRIKANVLLQVVNLAKIDGEIYSALDKDVTPAKFISKPAAHPPEGLYGASAKVSIYIVFGADGVPKLTLPLDQKLSAFTVEALQAANKLKVAPATKDGKPVMFRIPFEYGFNQ